MREYFEALIPEPVRVLGLKLKPFSAGHIALLSRMDNPLVAGGEITVSALADAVFVCAHGFADGIAALDNPDTTGFMERWRKEVGDFDLAEKLALFKAYISAGSKFEMVYVPKRASESTNISRVPFVQHVRATLMHYYGITSAEFWDMPWALALWDYYTAPVMEGTGDLASAGELNDAQAVANEMFKKLNPQLFEGKT